MTLATGVGSLPGTDPREAARLVLGELPDFAHLPELPARGPGADLTGRAAALLVDLHVDRQPSGWRLVDRAGRDERRARAWLVEDLDAVEEAAQGYAGPFKVQLAGPLTLAATLDLPRGDKALGDAGARRDITDSLAAAAAEHLADVGRRLPGAQLVLQLDEPALPSVLGGQLPTASGYRTFAALEPSDVREALRRVLDAAGTAGARSAVHCCAAAVPLTLLREAGAQLVSLDLALLPAAADEEVGTALEAGLTFLLGVVPATDTELSGLAATVAPVLALADRLGVDRERFADCVVLTPACGLAGASPAYARAALARVRTAARAVDEGAR